MMKETIFEAMENDILNTNLEENEKNILLRNLFSLKSNKINLLITGATGCGKSSTINALFGNEVSNVGIGVNPETMDIVKYELDNLILWDSPGLGDGNEADKKHSINITRKLKETDDKGNAIIDLVLVILDGSSRDLGTSYNLINKVIIPNLGANRKDRILVALNQADLAMKGRYWDYEKNEPEPRLQEFLEKKVISVQERIYEATGVKVYPIYYSAGFKEEGKVQSKPYNLSKLLYYIIKATPKEKRLVYVEKINNDSTVWKCSDNIRNYAVEIKRTFLETINDCALGGAEIGEEIGSLFGKTGEILGRNVGKVVGGILGGIKALFLNN